jgi:hypothetical protein
MDEEEDGTHLEKLLLELFNAGVKEDAKDALKMEQ